MSFSLPGLRPAGELAVAHCARLALAASRKGRSVVAVRARREASALPAATIRGGVIASFGLADGYLEHNDKIALLAAAALAAIGVRLIRALRAALTENEKILALAATDPLTGIGNRRKLMSDLDDLFTAEGPDNHLLVIYDLNEFKRYNDTFGHPTGDALLTRLARQLQTAVGADGACYRLGGDEFCTIATLPTLEIGRFLDRTTTALSAQGEGFNVTTSFGCVFLPDEAASVEAAMRVADQRLYAQKYQLVLARGEDRGALIAALEKHQPSLLKHAAGVAELSVRLASELRIAGDALDELGLAAQLHDVGKLATPDSVLTKTAPLDAHELAFVQRHTVVGQRILDASPMLGKVGKIVRSTHERWDGSGYPDGLTGVRIPLPARIIAVCDSFCAMTEDRGHNETRTRDDALAELSNLAGSHFDPELVALFCRLAPAVPSSR